MSIRKETYQKYLNKTFERLTVKNIVSERSPQGYLQTIANCVCSCGNIKNIKLTNIVNGTTKSCGCIREEQAIKNLEKISNKIEPYLVSARCVYRNHSYSDSDISFEEFLILSQRNCFYCGKSPQNCSNTYRSNRKSSYPNWTEEQISLGDFFYNGLDRIDNNKKHSKDNIVPCCFDCNRAKLKRTQESFFDWIKTIYELHDLSGQRAA